MAQEPLTVSIEATRGENKETTYFSLYLSHSAPECEFGIWSSPRRKRIRQAPGRGLLIATFGNPAQSIRLVARDVPPLRRREIKQRLRVFFRFVVLCDGDFTLSKISRYRVPRRQRRVSKNREEWILAVKEALQYAE